MSRRSTTKVKATADILEDFFIMTLKEDYRNLHAKELPAKSVKSISKIFQEKMADDDVYKSFSFVNGNVDKFILAFKYDCPFEGKIIKCWLFSVFNTSISKAIIKTEIGLMTKFFKTSNRPIKVAYHVTQKDLLANLFQSGFRIEGQKLIGKIIDGMKYINKKQIELCEGYEIKVPPKRDIKRMMKTEQDIHLHEPTSVATYTKKSIQVMSQFMETMIKGKSLFCVYDELKSPIGHIGIMYNQGIGHISTIAVSREYQGQGLSYILYEKAFREMKKRNIKRYTGYTATHKVLKQARNFKRHPYIYSLQLSPK